MPPRERPPRRRRGTGPRSGPIAVAGLAVALSLTALMIPAPVLADWIVTTDGDRIETDGPWQEKGRLVVFTTIDGQLTSMRADAIDFEASRLATESGDEPEPATPTPPAADVEKKKPVLVLTDEDVSHVDPAELAAAEGGDGAAEESAEESAEEAAEAGDLVVVDWDQSSPEEGGLVITGTLTNRADYVATSINLEVKVFDFEGEQVASTPAVLSARGLSPGEALNFRANFPDLGAIQNAAFEITNRGFDSGPPTPSEGEGSEIEATPASDAPDTQPESR